MSLQKSSHFLEEAKALVLGEENLVANLANLSSLIFYSFSDLNWAGFYLKDPKKNELVLGPFQGRVACLRIPFGKGVCGSAWEKGQSLNVADVHQFPGHIACDGASESELVIPIIKEGTFKAVLDVDSPVKNRFDISLESLLAHLVADVVTPLF